jgi:hypothetical protein
VTQLVDTLSKAAFLFSFFMICVSNSLYEKIELKENINTNLKLVLPHGAQDQTVA